LELRSKRIPENESAAFRVVDIRVTIAKFDLFDIRSHRDDPVSVKHVSFPSGESFFFAVEVAGRAFLVDQEGFVELRSRKRRTSQRKKE
jgi:hypothetical protein